MNTSTNFRRRGPAEAFRRVGFRTWYERQLLSGHAHMVLAVLSVIGLLASFEAFGAASADERMVNVMFVLICAGVSLWALRRYLFLLARAEFTANQASCQGCGEYGRFKVVGEGALRGDTDVCCRKCDHRWTISAMAD